MQTTVGLGRSERVAVETDLRRTGFPMCSRPTAGRLSVLRGAVGVWVADVRRCEDVDVRWDKTTGLLVWRRL